MPEGTSGTPRIHRMNAPLTYRIAMVAPCPFPSLRGSQVLIRELAESLAAAGHAVHVVTYPTAQHLVPVERIAIHRVPKLPGMWTACPFGWQKLVLDALLLVLLCRVVRRERIQVIHAHNLEGPVIAYLVRWLTGVPVVYHAHNALSDELPCYVRSRVARRLTRRIGAALDRRVAAAADYSIAMTDRLAAFLAARGAAGRVAVVPPAVRTIRRVERAPTRRSAHPQIMYAGNLDPYQDLQVLLDGFELVRTVKPTAQLVFVTHAGANRQVWRRMSALAGRPGVAVRVAPTFAMAMRLLRQADVVVCPRGSWSGFPIKVLNYMGLGRPIVHARASAHPIEDERTGLIFDDQDPHGLARAVLRVLRDGDLAARLGRTAQVAVQQSYAWPRVLPRVTAVYRHVLTGPERSRRIWGLGPQPGEKEHGMRHGEAWIDEQRFPHTQRPVMRGIIVFLACVLMGAAMGCSARRASAPAVLPPLASPMATDVANLPATYRLQPYDVLRVKYLYHPELDVKVPVGPDGSITVTGVGQIQAAGRTPEELAGEIEQRSSDRLREPVVEVIVAELGRYKVWVFGEVKSPGEVLYRDGMTPLQAISDRGGFTEYARADSVVRITPDGSATRIDLTGNLTDPRLFGVGANDVIYVPRTFVGDAVAFMRTFRNLLPVQPRIGGGFSLD